MGSNGSFSKVILNKENANKIWRLIQHTGDELLGKLPDHPNHPKGRNPYAHVALEVKNYFKMSYKDIPDTRYDEVVKYLQILKQNPN
jgi:hypothetical protein